MTDQPNTDPQGPPPSNGPSAQPQPCDQPARPKSPLRGLVTFLAGVAAVGVTCSLIVTHQTMALPGSTQSSRLLLQERQAQIDAAIAEQAQAAPADVDENADETPDQDGQQP